MTGWTQTPNFIYDLIPHMCESEIKVIMVILRETIGWQREFISLSLSDLQRLTKMARASVNGGIQAAIKRGILERTEDGQSFIYKIVEPTSSKSELVQNLNHFDDELVQNLDHLADETSSDFEPVDGTSSKSEPELVQNLDRQLVQNLNPIKRNIYTNKLNTEETREDAGATPAPPDAWNDFLVAFCWICHGHKDLGALTEKRKGILTSEAKRIYDKHYTIDDLRAWFRDTWQKDWRWTKDKKHERPEPSEVRSMIPAIRDNGYHVDDVDGLPGVYAITPVATAQPPPPLPPPMPHHDPWSILLAELLPTLSSQAQLWLKDSRLSDEGDLAGEPFYQVLVTHPAANLQWLARTEPTIRRKLCSLLGKRVNVGFAAATIPTIHGA